MTRWTSSDKGDDGYRRLLAGEQGVALVLVLWISTLFGLMLAGFAFSMRVETDTVKNFQDHAQALRLAESGIVQALAELEQAPASMQEGTEARPVWPARFTQRLGAGQYQVMVTNEDSRLSLNHVSETVLRKLLVQTGVTDEVLQDTIAASIMDWRDLDEVERPNGAESAYYQTRLVPHASKNALFQQIEELLSVRGMTRDILYGNIGDPARRERLLASSPDQREFTEGEYLGLARFVTAHGSGRIDQSLAEPDVLAAMGVPEDRIRELVAARSSAVGRNIPKLLHLEARGLLDHSPIATTVVAVVAMEGASRTTRYRVLAWQEQEG